MAHGVEPEPLKAPLAPVGLAALSPALSPAQSTASFARSADRLAFAWSSVAVSVDSVVCAVVSCVWAETADCSACARSCGIVPAGTTTVDGSAYPSVALTCVCDDSVRRVTVARDVANPLSTVPPPDGALPASNAPLATTNTTTDATTTAASARTVHRDNRTRGRLGGAETSVSSFCDMPESINADRSRRTGSRSRSSLGPITARGTGDEQSMKAAPHASRRRTAAQ